MDETKLNKPEELADEELNLVTGGAGVAVSRAATRNGKYYAYVGPKTEEALSSAYLCPKCGHAIAWGNSVWDWSTTCAGCGEKWWFEKNVNLNLKDGLWKEVTYREYTFVMGGYRLDRIPEA